LFKFIKKQWVLFCYALSFFSRIPVSKSTDFNAYPFHLGNTYFPVVGGIQALLWFAVYSVSSLLFEHHISIILMLVAGVLMTGAFHEDGFADSCDGFGGGYNKDQRLTIMKDSQIGTYAGIGLILLFVLKISVLTSLVQQILLTERTFLLFLIVLLNAAILSRFSALCLMQCTDYAGIGNNKCERSSHQLPKNYLLAAALFSAVNLFFLPLLWSLLLVALLVINTFLCRYYFNKQVKGYTGDCLGFVQQVNELLIFMTLLYLFSLGGFS